MNSRNAVRDKLLRAILGIWVLVTIATLGAVAVDQFRTNKVTARRMEMHFREHQRDKGRLLVTNQVLALRGMAAENAFSDVRHLVRQTVLEDADIIYGTFVEADGTPWVVVTPTPQPSDAEDVDGAATLAALPAVERPLPTRSPQLRMLNAFGANIEEHWADVWDGADYLGTVRYGFSLARTEAALRQARADTWKLQLQLLTLLTALGTLGITLGIVAIRKMAHRITEPLAELTRASEELGRGNRGVRAHVSSGDELEQLAHTFNTMAAASEQAMRELEIKTAEALESSRLKSEFLANMSHEIRTPMNGILGVVRLVNKMALEGRLRRYIETIDASASALLTIINDVLDFSKMEAGKYTLRVIAFDFRAVVQEVCELLAPRAHDKNIDLICRIDPKIRSIYLGDPDRLRQIINNLVGNAIKFTDQGEIFVDARVAVHNAQRETLRVSVADTGIGIAQSDIAKLFDAFSQLDGSMVRRYGGTGLGLAISKRLVDMMGGTIGVQSTLGVGSEFYFELPLDVENDISTDLATWATGKRAIVIENNPRWLTVLNEHLQWWGMEVAAFQSTEDLFTHLDSARQSDFDVAIISTQLTDLAFDDCVRRLHRRAEFVKLPIVAVSQLGGPAVVTDIEPELAAHLSKPLRLSELFNTLQVALGVDKHASEAPPSTQKLPGALLGKVLVVDDNEINRFVAAEMLEQLGYTVESADNGAEAVELVKQNEYMVVLMDCQMPVMDGYAATREIRRLESASGRHQPIVALTAHALSGERGRVLEAGMDDYLSKPVRPNSLHKMIHRYSRSRGKFDAKAFPTEALHDDTCLDASVARSNRLIELFLKNLPGQLHAIEEAAQKRNAPELRAQAHKTKGSCLALGATTMAQTAEQIQKHAEGGQLDKTMELLPLLRQQYDAVVVQLQQELGRELEDA